MFLRVTLLSRNSFKLTCKNYWKSHYIYSVSLQKNKNLHIIHKNIKLFLRCPIFILFYGLIKLYFRVFIPSHLL